MKKKVDYIILGQGIAGSLLAFELLQAGRSVLVVDDGHLSASSTVAAGMWNPIVFRRITKSWNADLLLPAMRETYQKLEVELGVQFYHPKPVVRLFREPSYINEWDEKSVDERYADFLRSAKNPEIEKLVHTPLGYGTVQGSGWVDLSVFLPAFRDYLSKKEAFLREKWNWEDLKLEGNKAIWGEFETDCVVNCLGYLGNENEYWKDLPLRRTKGEVLTVHIPNFEVEPIVNNGNYLLPLGNGVFRAGATYDHDFISSAPTEKGGGELLEKIKKLTDEPIEILEHKAGVRPTVKDRKPLVGRHLAYSQLAIFNGLGTKGVMIAPWLAQQFVAHFEQGAELSPEIDFRRFF